MPSSVSNSPQSWPTPDYDFRGGKVAESVLVVPPFTRIDMAPLGVHLLQACAERRGHGVRVIYANILLAAEIGVELMHALAFRCADSLLLADRVFARAAYGLAHLGSDADRRLAAWECSVELNDGSSLQIDAELLLTLSAHVAGFCERFADGLLGLSPGLVGCTAMVGQQAASVGILRALKNRCPQVATVVGGPAYEAPMGEALAAAAPSIDHVFCGESENAFVDFLDARRRGDPTGPRVIESLPVEDIEATPLPQFREYMEQLAAANVDVGPAGAHLPYEASRGCWWGRKHHCRFCSVPSMAYRHKSSDKVLAEVSAMFAASDQVPRLTFTDNILPNGFVGRILPKLAERVPGLRLFFQTKANLKLAELGRIAEAGTWGFLAGVEALSTPLLRRLDKGVTARQNLALLRYAHANGVSLSWFLLVRIPGDKQEDYQSYLELFPKIQHLCPPHQMVDLRLYRYSPYTRRPEDHGIRELRPAPAYAAIMPPGTDLDAAAFVYEASMGSVLEDDLALKQSVADCVEAWRHRWVREPGGPPILEVRKTGAGEYALRDTRGLPGVPTQQMLTREQVAMALVGTLPRDPQDTRTARWALDSHVCIELDERLVPLAVASPELLQEFEQAARLCSSSPRHLQVVTEPQHPDAQQPRA